AGDWDEAFELAAEWLPEEPVTHSSMTSGLGWLAWARLDRGEIDEMRRLLALVAPEVESTSDLQLRASLNFKRDLLALAEHGSAALLGRAGGWLRRVVEPGFIAPAAFMVGMALDVLQDRGGAAELLPLVDLLDATPTAHRSRQLDLEIERTRGVVASLGGNH